MKTFLVSIIVVALVLLASCGGDSPPSDRNVDPDPDTHTTRSFYMGFTPWLYEASIAAQNATYSRLEAHGDIIKHHLLGGIPWQEALDGQPYHANVEAELQARISRTPDNSEVFLAIDSLNSARTALAPYRGAMDNMPLTGDWATRTWSSQEVIDAYIAYAEDMINRFEPRYFEYGTEASELLLNDAAAFTDYLIFAEAVYGSLKSTYPNLTLIISIALKSPGSDEMQTIQTNIGSLLAFSDVVGISVYPYAFFNHADKGDPANLPLYWLDQINDFSGDKPLAISETGWIAEDLDIAAFTFSESSSAAKQNAYLDELLIAANDKQMEFVIWWSVTDFDTLWNVELAQDPVAKIWKDIGLYDENQLPRSALQTWDSWYDKTRQGNQ